MKSAILLIIKKRRASRAALEGGVSLRPCLLAADQHRQRVGEQRVNISAWLEALVVVSVSGVCVCEGLGCIADSRAHLVLRQGGGSGGSGPWEQPVAATFPYQPLEGSCLPVAA